MKFKLYIRSDFFWSRTGSQIESLLEVMGIYKIKRNDVQERIYCCIPVSNSILNEFSVCVLLHVCSYNRQQPLSNLSSVQAELLKQLIH